MNHKMLLSYFAFHNCFYLSGFLAIPYWKKKELLSWCSCWDLKWYGKVKEMNEWRMTLHLDGCPVSWPNQRLARQSLFHLCSIAGLAVHFLWPLHLLNMSISKRWMLTWTPKFAFVSCSTQSCGPQSFQAKPAPYLNWNTTTCFIVFIIRTFLSHWRTFSCLPCSQNGEKLTFLSRVCFSSPTGACPWHSVCRSELQRGTVST